MSALFLPTRIGPLTLRNRVVKAAAFEGMCPGGQPSAALVEHHRRVAAGGAALCTVAYAAVSPCGRTFGHQMWLHRDLAPALRPLTDALHREGAAAAIQIGHAGCMADSRVTGRPVLAPSRVPNLYGLTLPRAMDARDIDEMVAAFATATRIARESGFDAVEIQASHGYLISQFLSPYTNRRRDAHGGSLDNRARLLIAVLRRVREAAGVDMAVTVKMNLRDGFRGGLELPEAIEVARIAEREGADALQLSGGFSSKTPWYILRGDVPWKEIVAGERRPLHKLGAALFGRFLVEPFPFEEAYFFSMAREVRAAVALPLMLVGGLRTRATIDQVLAAGIDLVAMARPFIRDPAFTTHLKQDAAAKSACVPCNRCVASMYHADQRCPYASA
jgi:2,4-dienoyl-CoA reductase-like NADH-dependent reductase (Old Yellow Enzyme family)